MNSQITASAARTRKLTLSAMLSAMTYIVMYITHLLPAISLGFLQYDPKDVVIAIGGFLLGPMPAVGISLLVSFLEMITVSSTGFIGLFMNVLATCAFVCPAAWLYRKNRSLRSAAVGLCLGVVSMTGIMLAWNYIITPMYMGYPREAIVKMMLPVFLPFNLIKGSLNAGITMLLYKPVATALRKAKFIAPSESVAPVTARRFNLGATIVSAILVITAVLCFYTLGK